MMWIVGIAAMVLASSVTAWMLLTIQVRELRAVLKSCEGCEAATKEVMELRVKVSPGGIHTVKDTCRIVRDVEEKLDTWNPYN